MTRSSPSTLIGPSAVLTIVVAACGAAPPVRPVAPVFDTIAPLIGSTESEDRTTYSLADGRIWQRQNDQFRVIYDMPGKETLFVAGTDPEGAYVLLVGSQDGLPAECSYALRYGGRDWGDAVESQGLLWPEAPEFVGIEGQPTPGQAYPSNAGFCLEDRGQVTSAYLAEPPLERASAGRISHGSVRMSPPHPQ